MGTEATSWQIPLLFKPQVLHAAVALHTKTTSPPRQARGLWCLYLYRYAGTLQIHNRVHEFRPGFAALVPPSAPTILRTTQSPAEHACAHFSLPDLRSDAIPIPITQDLGQRFPDIDRRFREAVGFFPTQPRRCEVRIWDILWELAGTPSTANHNPIVQAARQYIELNLHAPIRVAALARHLGISHNHLTRLIHAATGQTVAGYIRQRRIDRARHLIAHTTVPISAIAAEVGIPDLQLFNKLIRKTLGASPRNVRHAIGNT